MKEVQFVLRNGGFGYKGRSVVCTFVDGQFLLEPLGSVEETNAIFASLPDTLKLMVGEYRSLKLGNLRKAIRGAIKGQPRFPVLAIRTEIRPGEHYLLCPDALLIARAWIEELIKVSKVNWGNAYLVELVSETKESTTHRLSFKITELHRYAEVGYRAYEATVEIESNLCLKVIRTNLPPNQTWVRGVNGKLFHGEPRREILNFSSG